MLEDRRLSFAVESHQLYVKPQLRRAKANQFLKELEGLLLREPIEEPDESDLIGKAEPVMRAPTVAELHEIFLGQGGGTLELLARKHYRCDTANAEVRKEGFLAYKITRICLVPWVAAQWAPSNAQQTMVVFGQAALSMERPLGEVTREDAKLSVCDAGCDPAIRTFC